MIHFTHAAQFTVIEEHVGVTEASTIGLRPGEWPEFIAVMREPGTDSEGFLTERFGPVFQDEDEDRTIVGYEYSDRRARLRITVYND